MDIFFQDPNEIPLPPSEIRIQQFTADPYPDGRRVKIYLEVSPFQKRPSVDVNITNSDGLMVSQASIIESISRKMEFTMHLRGPEPAGKYFIKASIFYEKEPLEKENTQKEEFQKSEKILVDHREVEFQV